MQNPMQKTMIRKGGMSETTFLDKQSQLIVIKLLQVSLVEVTEMNRSIVGNRYIQNLEV